MSIDFNDTEKHYINDRNFRTKYRCYCDSCGADKGYLSKQNATDNKPCRKCCHKNISEETRQKMAKAKIGKKPGNTGRKDCVSPEGRLRMRLAKIGTTPHNKNKKIPEKQKIKISCSVLGIDQEDFDGFKTGQDKRYRDKFKQLNLSNLCFERDNYKCRKCGQVGHKLNAHHANSWKFFPEERYELDNLICLCRKCHKLFHKHYGSGMRIANTRDQIDEFLLEIKRDSEESHD